MSPSLLNPYDLSDASDSQQTETASQVKDNTVSLGGLSRREKEGSRLTRDVCSLAEGTPSLRTYLLPPFHSETWKLPVQGLSGVISMVPTTLRDWGAKEHPCWESRLGHLAGP